MTESNGSGTCTGSHAYAVASGGSRTIVVRVTDDDLGAGTDSRAISVSTPRTLKQDALDRANALLPGASKHDQGKLKDVVKEITTSLDPSRWIDDIHLSKTKGHEVFDHEKIAAKRLMDLLDGTSIPDSAIQPMIDDLLNADRFLAQTAIGDAVAAGGKPVEDHAGPERAGARGERGGRRSLRQRRSTTTRRPGSTPRRRSARSVGRGAAVAELQQPVGCDRRRARDQEARLPPEQPEEAERDTDAEQRPEHDLRGARSLTSACTPGPSRPRAGSGVRPSR